MTVPILAFFNNQGGVGKTSLVYHLAWMYSNLELRVLAVDLDPQANLTAAFLDEDRLEEIWQKSDEPNTIFRCVQPLIRGIGNIANPKLETVEERLFLLPGDLFLSGFEDELATEWWGCLAGKEESFRVISAFWYLLQLAAETCEADIILADLGSNLGAINRAAVIASDYVVFPLSPDLFSLQGLQNFGPTLRRWRGEWQERLSKNPVSDTSLTLSTSLTLPPGQMQPLGYIVLQHSTRLDRPVKAYQRWMAQIPNVYQEAVLGESVETLRALSEDPNCLAVLKPYQSLMPLAQDARKPMFHLKPADGAIGAHLQAAHSAYRDFQQLAEKITVKIGFNAPYFP